MNIVWSIVVPLLIRAFWNLGFLYSLLTLLCYPQQKHGFDSCLTITPNALHIRENYLHRAFSRTFKSCSTRSNTKVNIHFRSFSIYLIMFFFLNSIFLVKALNWVYNIKLVNNCLPYDSYSHASIFYKKKKMKQTEQRRIAVSPCTVSLLLSYTVPSYYAPYHHRIITAWLTQWQQIQLQHATDSVDIDGSDYEGASGEVLPQHEVRMLCQSLHQERQCEKILIP